MKASKRILIIIAAAAIAAAAFYYAWQKGAFLPDWIQWEEKSVSPSSPDEISLTNRHLTVRHQGQRVWESEPGILVQDFLWCDINHDDRSELILLCWRIGRYGNARPYWVEKDEHAWSQHIYIYEWSGEEIHPLWMASDIGMDVVSFQFSETSRLQITETSGRQTSWDWLSWGLTLLKEIKPENP